MLYQWWTHTAWEGSTAEIYMNFDLQFHPSSGPQWILRVDLGHWGHTRKNVPFTMWWFRFGRVFLETRAETTDHFNKTWWNHGVKLPGGVLGREKAADSLSLFYLGLISYTPYASPTTKVSDDEHIWPRFISKGLLKKKLQKNQGPGLKCQHRISKTQKKANFYVIIQGIHLQYYKCTLKLELITKTHSEIFKCLTLMSDEKSVVLQVIEQNVVFYVTW